MRTEQLHEHGDSGSGGAPQEMVTNNQVERLGTDNDRQSVVLRPLNWRSNTMYPACSSSAFRTASGITSSSRHKIRAVTADPQSGQTPSEPTGNGRVDGLQLSWE